VAGVTNSFGACGYDFWVLKLGLDGRLMGNCLDIEKDTDAKVIPTEAEVKNTNAIITNPIVTVLTTDVIPKDTNCIVQAQCTAP
jgi:hypothetical protein